MHESIFFTFHQSIILCHPGGNHCVFAQTIYFGQQTDFLFSLMSANERKNYIISKEIVTSSFFDHLKNMFLAANFKMSTKNMTLFSVTTSGCFTNHSLIEIIIIIILYFDFCVHIYTKLCFICFTKN